MKVHICVLAAAFFAIAGSTAWSATTQDDIDEAKRVQQLAEARKATADARKGTAEAEAAEAKAKLGTLDTSKLTKPTGEGKTLNVEGNILAYSAADRIAKKIADAVAPPASSASNAAAPVVILGEKDINGLQQAKSFKQGLLLLNDAMSKFRVPILAADDAQCKEPTVGGAGLGVLGSIDVALQIAQLFKVDKKFEGSDVSVDDFALASMVMPRLLTNGVKTIVYGPAYVAGVFGGKDPFAASVVATNLNQLGDRQDSIDIQIAEIARRREKLKAREDDQKVKLPDTCKQPFEEAKRIYTALESRGKNLKDRADKFLAAATTVDDKTGASLLQTLVQAETMASRLAGARVLRLKPIAGGGTVFTRTTMFSTHVGVGGGAVVAYMLLDGDEGSVLVSGTVADYGGFAEPQELAGILAGQR